MNRIESIQSIVNTLHSSMPELKGVLLATTDGLAIAQSLGNGVDSNRLSAMSATALGLGRRICESLTIGALSETSVSGADGNIYLYSTGNKGVLAVIAGAGANVGFIHMEARGAARNLSELL